MVGKASMDRRRERARSGSSLLAIGDLRPVLARRSPLTTADDCGDLDKEWKIFPPEWECTGRRRTSGDASRPTTGSSRSPTTSARPTSATPSPRAPSRRSRSSSTRSALEPGHARARRRAAVPVATPTPSPARGLEVVGVDISQRFVDLAAEAAPPGATFQRADARALAFDAEFDAAISLCQGAFGLTGGPGAPLDGDGAVLGGHGAGAATGRPPGRVGLLRLLPGPLPRGPATASTPQAGVNHERTEVRDEDGAVRRGRPVDDLLHAPRAPAAGGGRGPRGRAPLVGHARAPTRADAPTIDRPELLLRRPPAVTWTEDPRCTLSGASRRLPRRVPQTASPSPTP